MGAAGSSLIASCRVAPPIRSYGLSVRSYGETGGLVRLLQRSSLFVRRSSFGVFVYISDLAQSYDVIVVGGGPAGALTAYHLAKAGVRTAVLDACVFPRDKTCGGGMQHRAAMRIPFDWSAARR